jgi:hypothetical protein
MVMHVPAPTAPGVVQAERDMAIRRGGGMDDTRPLIAYDELRALQEAGRGVKLRQYGVVMRAPDRDGTPGAGAVLALPAEKFQKWIGQGYRPTQSVEDHAVREFPAPPPPLQWLPSMVEDAMALGEPVPEEMAPTGYMGVTFKLKPKRQAVARAAASKASKASTSEPSAVAEPVDEEALDAE